MGERGTATLRPGVWSKSVLALRTMGTHAYFSGCGNKACSKFALFRVATKVVKVWRKRLRRKFIAASSRFFRQFRLGRSSACSEVPLSPLGTGFSGPYQWAHSLLHDGLAMSEHIHIPHRMY